MSGWTIVQAKYQHFTIDTWEEVDYKHPYFYRSTRAGTGPTTIPTKMTRDQLNTLAAEIQSQIQAATPATDRPGLEAFLELIRRSLPRNQSSKVPA